MKKKTCLIVENNPVDLNILLSYLEKLPNISVVKTVDNYHDAIIELNKTQVDILFLDIEIDGPTHKNGFDILNAISYHPAIIVTSNHDAYAIKSFEVGKIVDFLHKPFELERFILAIVRANKEDETKTNDSKYIFFKMGRKVQKFNLDAILYFEAYGIYTKVYLQPKAKCEIINENLSTLIQRLDPNKFIRTHKSYIVNFEKIQAIDSNMVELDNQIQIPIGITYKSKFESLQKLLTDF